MWISSSWILHQISSYTVLALIASTRNLVMDEQLKGWHTYSYVVRGWKWKFYLLHQRIGKWLGDIRTFKCIIPWYLHYYFHYHYYYHFLQFTVQAVKLRICTGSYNLRLTRTLEFKNICELEQKFSLRQSSVPDAQKYHLVVMTSVK